MRGAALTLLRLPGRSPVPGWSVVIERLHGLMGYPSSEVLYRTRFGVTLRLDLADYVQRRIFYEVYEAAELDFVRRHLQPGDTMIDVGANVGVFSLVAARTVGPAGQVHAFEPVPLLCERLRANVTLNGFDTVRLNPVAVGRSSGTLSLGLPDDAVRGAEIIWGSYTVGAALHQVTAPVVALDDYLPPGASVRLVKIDVEGFEPDVLAGLRGALEERRIDIVMFEVSVYNLARHGRRVADAVGPLTDAGYRLHLVGAFGRLRPWRYTGEPSVPTRVATGGLVDTIRVGLQDRHRHFNLVALRPR